MPILTGQTTLLRRSINVNDVDSPGTRRSCDVVSTSMIQRRSNIVFPVVCKQRGLNNVCPAEAAWGQPTGHTTLLRHWIQRRNSVVYPVRRCYCSSIPQLNKEKIQCIGHFTGLCLLVKIPGGGGGW